MANTHLFKGSVEVTGDYLVKLVSFFTQCPKSGRIETTRTAKHKDYTFLALQTKFK